jgi:predicted regulator of Ras-like GTPase activity (Roadblock/LC7/MglB family)
MIPDLEGALSELQSYEGVQDVLMLGRDGLLIRHLGHDQLDSETAAAMVPEIASTCTALGSSSGRGDLRTAVVEFTRGVAIILTLSDDLLLAVLVAPGVGFAHLLAELRRQRDHFAALV